MKLKDQVSSHEVDTVEKFVNHRESRHVGYWKLKSVETIYDEEKKKTGIWTSDNS